MKTFLMLISTCLAFTLSAQTVLEKEFEIISMVAVAPDEVTKIYGPITFFKGGLTAYALIKRHADYFHVIGIPNDFFSFNNMFYASFTVIDPYNLSNKKLDKNIVERWVQCAFTPNIEYQIGPAIPNHIVYLKTDRMVEKVLRADANNCEQ